MRPDQTIDVRLARNEESSEIQALLRYCGFAVDDLDWSEIYLFWLVAVHDGPVTPANLGHGLLTKLPASPIGAALDLLRSFEEGER